MTSLLVADHASTLVFSGSGFWLQMVQTPEILTPSTKRLLQQTAGNGPTNSNGQHQAVATGETEDDSIKDGCVLAFRMGVVGRHGGYNTAAVHRPFGKDHYL